MLKKLSIEPKFFNGLRITDEETMEVVEMVLAGTVNKGIVNDIQLQGVDALGLCGKDGNLLEAKKKIIDGKDLGFVGEVVNVKTSLLKEILKNHKKGCQNWQPFFYSAKLFIVILAIQFEFKFFINQNITQL